MTNITIFLEKEWNIILKNRASELKTTQADLLRKAVDNIINDYERTEEDE